MKVEFDDWSTCFEGTAFILEMECVPRVGDVILIHKSLFPSSYFEDTYVEHPMTEDDGFVGMIRTTISVVEHHITAEGHLVRVCIEV